MVVIHEMGGELLNNKQQLFIFPNLKSTDKCLENAAFNIPGVLNTLVVFLRFFHFARRFYFKRWPTSFFLVELQSVMNNMYLSNLPETIPGSGVKTTTRLVHVKHLKYVKTR